ncbi:MAG: serine hydrolase [Bacteroidota bacterium]
MTHETARFIRAVVPFTTLPLYGNIVTHTFVVWEVRYTMGRLYSILVILLLGACTPYRLVTLNLANQDDYKRFPNKIIEPSDDRWHFSEQRLPSESLYVDMFYGKKRKNIPLEEFLEGSKNIAFLVIQDDKVLFEKYSKGYDAQSLLTSFSISKSFVSALVGIAIQEGAITSDEDPITDYLPQLQERPGFEKIKIKHLLNHTSGIKFNESYVNPFNNDIARYYYGKDLQKTLKKLKIDEEPETSFHYHSANTQLLALVLAEATGESLSDYFESRIWSRIGTTNKALWSTYEKEPLEKAFCCVNAVARDYAKFGKLMAQGGVWEGEQIIPEQWIEESIQLDRTDGGIWGYQNQWIMGLKEYGDFMAQGLYDQYLYVMPRKKIVIVSFNSAHIPKTNWEGRFRQIVDQL